MAAQIRIFSLPRELAAVVDAVAEREGGVSAAGQMIIRWFMANAPADYLAECGITPIIAQIVNEAEAA